MKAKQDFGEKFGKYKFAIFKGTSMFPLLRQGDLLFILEVSPEKIKAGELFCFYKNGTFICHRLIHKRRIKGKILFFERADNSGAYGDYIEPEMIIGRAEKALRGKREIDLRENFIKRYLNLIKPLFLKCFFYLLRKSVILRQQGI